MKSYESTLAFFYGSRICRLSSTILQLTIYLKHISIFISLLSIFSLIPSVTAIQQQVVNQTNISSSIIPINGTTTTTIITTNTTTTATATIFNSSHQQLQSTIPLLSLTTTTATYNEHLLNTTNNTSQNQPEAIGSPARLILVIIVCSLMSLLTIVGNLIVILTVCLVRKLQTASNILIVSLAVSDIFVGLFIMPLALVFLITETWKLGAIMCDIWTSTDVLLCTASILNFLVISIDRYFIINHPFKYAPMRKVKLLSFMIAGVWILSALVSLPPILGWGRPSENLANCQVNTKLNYQIFATMLSFYIPLVVVLIIYANIYRTAQTAMDTRSSVQMSQFLTHHNSSVNIGQTIGALSQQQSNGNSYSTPQIYLNVANANNNNNNNDDNCSLSGEGRSLRRSGNISHESKSSSFLSPARCLGRRISTPFNGRLSIFVARRHTFFRHVHLPNQKAIRTLGVILGTFIVCWLPFMLFAIIKPLHERITGVSGPSRALNVPDWLDPVLLWFGYSSAMLNPIIYSKFNREFRTPFREIMCCRCKGLNEKIRRQEYLENLYGENHLQPPAPPLHMATSTKTSGYPEVVV